MNKEYIYNGGNVTVIDENGIARPIEYCDNLAKILIQENLIEDIENRISKLELNLKNNKENDRPYIPYIVPSAILGLIVTKILANPLLEIDTTLMVDTIFGTMNNGSLIIGILGALILPPTIIMEILSYKQDKHWKKSRRSDVAEYEYLKKEVVIQKAKLEELKQDKTKTTEISGFKVEKVNDLETLNALKSWITLYSNLGYSIEEYYKLYGKGKLEEQLTSMGYTELACERAKEYIEEKGPTLVKKRILSRNTGNK